METPEIESLNSLLEDERASVEIEVALVNSATDHSDRHALAEMGTHEVGYCVALRERLDRYKEPVTPRVNGVVLDVLGIERYDERLSAFADHQMRIAEAMPALLGSTTDDDLRALLRDIEDSHLRSAAWSRRRASTFAATRMLVFRGHTDSTYPESVNSSGGVNGAHVTPLAEG